MAAGTIAASVASVARPMLAAASGARTTPTRDQFDRWVGTTFQVHLDALRVVPLRLERVTDAARDRAIAGHEHFSVLFHGPTATPLPQQTYRMEHAEGGSLAIFIVPMERREGGLTYEAVFHCPRAGA